jgi:hypothetical protein
MGQLTLPPHLRRQGYLSPSGVNENPDPSWVDILDFHRFNDVFGSKSCAL